MNPTYKNGDILLVEKIGNTYERFDVVTFRKNDKTYIKRIIGIPGDDIIIIDGLVFVNGSKLDDIIDIKIKEPGNANSPIILRENEYFVLGDNRNNSIDSRSSNVGIVTADDIFGRVIWKLPI